MNPVQHMIIACVGGVLISSSAGRETLIYGVLALVLFFIQKQKRKIIKTFYKVAVFFFFVYCIGGILSAGNVYNGISQGFLKSLPFITSLFFIITLGIQLNASSIEISIKQLLAPYKRIPGREIAFMIGMSFRFLQEAREIWKTHIEILRLRRKNGVTPVKYSIALLYSPLMNLFSRADNLTDAYLLRHSMNIDFRYDNRSKSVSFWIIFCFLFAIKIVTIYTT